MFEENGFEVYEHREAVIERAPGKPEAERDAERRRLAVNELMERVRDRYWRIEERNTEEAVAFVNQLDNLLNPILNI